MARAAETRYLRVPFANIRKADTWSIGVAAVFMILGVSAIAVPAIADVPTSLLIGWLLTAGGIAHVSMMFLGTGTPRVIWQVILGIIYFIGGVYFLIYPLSGLDTFTMYLSAIILAEGVLDLIAYFRMRDEMGSVWLLTNGLTTLLLGGLISIHWPSTSGWALEILVGANLFLTGFSRLMLSMATPKSTSSLAR